MGYGSEEHAGNSSWRRFPSRARSLAKPASACGTQGNDPFINDIFYLSGIKRPVGVC
jgi:hypothetical protein